MHVLASFKSLLLAAIFLLSVDKLAKLYVNDIFLLGGAKQVTWPTVLPRHAFLLAAEQFYCGGDRPMN